MGGGVEWEVAGGKLGSSEVGRNYYVHSWVDPLQVDKEVGGEDSGKVEREDTYG